MFAASGFWTSGRTDRLTIHYVSSAKKKASREPD